MRVVTLPVWEGIKLCKEGGIIKAGEFVCVVGGSSCGEVGLAMQEVLEKGMQPCARDGGLCGVIHEGEGESLVCLDQDRGWCTVGPQFRRDWDCLGRGMYCDHQTNQPGLVGGLCAFGEREGVLVWASLAGDAVVEELGGVEHDFVGVFFYLYSF